mmetsp:Transcript_59895/g.112925  ORF Transcript_59895/g.112925 Transcript_59895/m.112925 type:complete len:162 (-) Transcript_59895:140-625(-)
MTFIDRPSLLCHEQITQMRLESKLSRAVSSEKLRLAHELDTLGGVARGRDAMLKYCHTQSSPKSVAFMDMDDEESMPALFLDEEEDDVVQVEGTAGSPEPHMSVHDAAVTGTVYNRGRKTGKSSAQAVYYGVDSAVFGVPKNTEPAFPTVGDIMKHIAASR